MIEQKMDAENRKRLMLGAIKTPEGREALKMVMFDMYPDDVANKIVNAIEKASNKKIKRLVNALFETFVCDGTSEEKAQMLLKEVTA